MECYHRIPLPRQWPGHVKSGVLHAISLAGVVLTYGRARAIGRSRLRAELEQANAETALLREELSIKDGRWERSQSRRRPHYTPTQRMRILQLRAARGWTLEKAAVHHPVEVSKKWEWLAGLNANHYSEPLNPVAGYTTLGVGRTAAPIDPQADPNGGVRH